MTRDLVARVDKMMSDHMAQIMTPIPVSERMPETEDCIPHPRTGIGHWCWGLEASRSSYGMRAVWRFMRREDLAAEARLWLPAHAIPLPQQEGSDV